MYTLTLFQFFHARVPSPSQAISQTKIRESLIWTLGCQQNLLCHNCHIFYMNVSLSQSIFSFVPLSWIWIRIYLNHCNTLASSSMPKEESLEINLFTWWVFPVPDADWLVGVWAPHGDQPLVIACELDTFHTMGPVGAGHPQHWPLGDDWPHQDRVLVRPRVSRGQVRPRVAPSQAADVITVTLENLQWN